MIILQLKSTQNTNALEDISSIVSYLYSKHNYKIRGHEIQQINSNIEKMSTAERTNAVSSFCSKHELDYLTYHTPFLLNEANFSCDYDDIKWHKKVADSILITIKEAEKVYSDASLKHKVIIVFHVNRFISKQNIPLLTKETKSKVLKKSVSSLIDYLYTNDANSNDDIMSNLYQDENEQQQHCYLLAVENGYPKPFANSHQLIGFYHPTELVELNIKYKMKVTLDLSHYQIYSNYLLHGKGNAVGDLERKVYGSHLTSWKECINILGNSLVQLHISDAKGIDRSGEGLPIKEGEIDIVGILNQINSLEEGKKIIQGTIELKDGHLHHGKLQKQSADWLLTNARDILG
jgi:hypothetical protein